MIGRKPEERRVDMAWMTHYAKLEMFVVTVASTEQKREGNMEKQKKLVLLLATFLMILPAYVIGNAAANGEVLLIERVSSSILYGSIGMPEESGQETVTLMIEYSPAAFDADGEINIVETERVQADYHTPDAPVFDYYRSIFVFDH